MGQNQSFNPKVRATVFARSCCVNMELIILYPHHVAGIKEPEKEDEKQEEEEDEEEV